MATRAPAQQRAGTGAIAGFVLRLARESIPLTQAAMAEALLRDLATIQGWESGRRPLGNVAAIALLELKRRLPALGADPAVVRLLDAAMDADRVISAALAPPQQPGHHPLADWVHTRDTAHMIAWAVNGTTPPPLRPRLTAPRRGPVAKAPLMSATDRTAFFAHLRDVTDGASRTGQEDALLYRQALYLTSYDLTAETTRWTAHTLHARRGALSTRGWTSRWAEARSTATALARLGDPQPLMDFIERGMVDDDTAEAANLNYWAYWLGALPDTQADDAFMRDRTLSGWDPVTLLRGLLQGFHQAPGFVDLYIHSLWALVTSHNWLPMAVPDLAARLGERTDEFMSAGGLSAQARRELDGVHYVLRENSK